MITKYFDFKEALDYIEAGDTVSLTLNGTERHYRKNQFGDIVCIPRGNENLMYKVHDFKIDAILSNNWINLTDEQA